MPTPDAPFTAIRESPFDDRLPPPKAFLRRRRQRRPDRNSLRPDPGVENPHGLQDANLCVLRRLDLAHAGGWLQHDHHRSAEPPIRPQQPGLPDSLASCHTGLIDGYVVEGHVPARDVIRLLAERPAALGLAVPAMPLGSPGMETPQGHKDPYDTLLVLRSGATQVFARHNPPT